jgi:5-methyltetrahydropteroyltriglutamate--homocysteine methyltransferase
VKRSTERILTTHVGSLVRPVNILRGMKARTIEQPYDRQVLAQDVRDGIHAVVRQQVELGIDIPSDGEFGRPGFVNYIHERLSGIQRRPLDPDEDIWGAGADREQQVFPEFFEQYHDHFRYLWMPPDVPIDDVPNLPGNYEKFRLTDKVSYVGQQAIQQDIATLKAALDGVSVADALIPGVISHQTNVLEHPELVAWRLKNFASVVGKENVIGGVDCGFSQYCDSIRVHPTVQWAKLQALVDGAALASKDLWP